MSRDTDRTGGSGSSQPSSALPGKEIGKGGKTGQRSGPRSPVLVMVLVVLSAPIRRFDSRLSTDPGCRPCPKPGDLLAAV
jgi:hypothetical protein